MIQAGTETRPAELSAQMPFWVESFAVHSFEADFQGKITLESLCHRFQEAAWNHAEQLGVGFEFLRRQNRIWVLSRLALRIFRLPSWGETLNIHTWPRNAKSAAFALRDFEIFDSSGAKCVSGASAWLVLDSTSRKPKRIDKLLAGMGNFSTREALQREPAKLDKVISQNDPPRRTANYSEIDVNAHVNNARYIGWIMDSYSFDFHRAHSLESLEVNYLGETLCGEMVSVLSQQTAPGEFCHSVVKTMGIEVFRAKLNWVLSDISPKCKPLHS